MQTEQKTAFVFAGGGSLGAIQVGMLGVLLSAGLQPDFVIGTSVGALNACYFAGAPNAEGAARLAKIWSSVRRSDIFSFTFASAFGMLRKKGHFVDSKGLRRLIETNLPYACLEDSAIPVHIVATDVQGMPVFLSNGPAIDAVLASAAIPGIFPPVQIDGKLLMDGAIAANTPIQLAADLGASRIIVLPTGYSCAMNEPPRSAIARALHAINLLIAWQLIRDLDRIPDEIEVIVVPTLCPLTVSPYDFSASHYLMECAADSTRKWLASGGLSRRWRPGQLHAHSH
ncbi:MAG: patatin-like phospholipase family protein [Methylocella sp.]